jgi:hypothetical protein
MMHNMTVWNRLFREHPASVGETYGQHFMAAAGFSFRMIWGGIVCLVHAVIPGMYCTKGSEMISELHDRMVTNRRRQTDSRAMPVETRRAA